MSSIIYERRAWLKPTNCSVHLTLFEVLFNPTINQPQNPQYDLKTSPNFGNFPISVWTIWRARTFLFFHSDFGCFEGDCVDPPPNYCIFSTPPQIGLKTIISRRKQKKSGPPQKIAGDRPCVSWLPKSKFEVLSQGENSKKNILKSNSLI